MAPRNAHQSCAVAICQSPKNPDVIYHSFPTDPRMAEKWIKACLRKDSINVKNARVCSTHFLESDYQRDLQNELLGLPPRKRLKKDAVPSQLTGSEERSKLRLMEEEELQKNEKEEQKLLVEKILREVENEVLEDEEEEEEEFVQMESQDLPEIIRLDFQSESDVLHFNYCNALNNGWLMEKSVQVDVQTVDVYSKLLAENSRLKDTIAKQKENLAFLNKRVRNLEKGPSTKKLVVAGDKTSVSVVDAESVNLGKRKIWPEEEIFACLTLKSKFPEAYQFISQNKLFSVPTATTLSKFSHLKSKYQVTPHGFIDRVNFPEAGDSPEIRPFASDSLNNKDVCHEF